MNARRESPAEALIGRRAAPPQSARQRLLAGALLALTLAIGTVLAQMDNASAQSVPAPAAAAPSAEAAQPASVLPPEEVTRRVKSLEKELRCLVCQNQTLADSNADLAKDLRDQVVDQVSQGKSDDEVKAYLVARYGDFVLYRPPFKLMTVGLWLGPFALLLVGGVIFVMIQRRQRARGKTAAGTAAGSADQAAAVASDKEHERARKLLD